MSNADGIIRLPINIETDLGYVLGTGSGEVSTNFCSPAVKPWARFKGISSSTLGFTGKTAGNLYWRGSDFKCGFSFQTFTSFGTEFSNPNSFIRKLYEGQIDWVYVHPTGLPYSPYRPWDFDGYDHNAESPIGELGSKILYLSFENGERVLHIDYDYIARPINEDWTSSQPLWKKSDWLSFADISPDGGATFLDGYYLGVFLYHQQWNRWYVLTGTSTVGSESISMTCQFPADQAGTWEMVPFLSKNIIPLKSVDVADGVFLALENRHRETVEIKLGSVEIIPWAMYDSARNVAWEIVVDNDDGSIKYFTGCSINVQRTTSPDSSENGTAVGTKSIADFQVPGHGTIYRVGSDTLGYLVANEDYDEQYTYWVRFVCDQTTWGYISRWYQIDKYVPIE